MPGAGVRDGSETINGCTCLWGWRAEGLLWLRTVFSVSPGNHRVGGLCFCSSHVYHLLSAVVLWAKTSTKGGWFGTKSSQFKSMTYRKGKFHKNHKTFSDSSLKDGVTPECIYMPKGTPETCVNDHIPHRWRSLFKGVYSPKASACLQSYEIIASIEFQNIFSLPPVTLIYEQPLSDC